MTSEAVNFAFAIYYSLSRADSAVFKTTATSHVLSVRPYTKTP